jgi:hypothetical protein
MTNKIRAELFDAIGTMITSKVNAGASLQDAAMVLTVRRGVLLSTGLVEGEDVILKLLCEDVEQGRRQKGEST